jgi:hypothetical protein
MEVFLKLALWSKRGTNRRAMTNRLNCRENYCAPDWRCGKRSPPERALFRKKSCKLRGLPVRQNRRADAANLPHQEKNRWFNASEQFSS